MGGPMDFPFALPFRAIVADNHEFHSPINWMYRSLFLLGEKVGGYLVDGTTIIVSGRDFVPPADFFLAQFPAQINDSAITDMRKVTQPKINVLNNDPQLMDGMEVDADVLEAFHVGCANWRSASVTGIGRCSAHLLAGAHKDGFPFPDGRQMQLELGNQLIGLVERKNAPRSRFVFIACHIVLVEHLCSTL
jgi:hypothetical protein